MNQGNNPLYGASQTAIGTWDAGTTTLATNASASCTAGSIWIPDGALITSALYFVQTTFIDDDAGDSQPMALGYTGATAGIHGTLVGTPILGNDAAQDTALELIELNNASMIHLTAPKELLLTLADERTVAVGKLSLYVNYVQTGDFA